MQSTPAPTPAPVPNVIQLRWAAALQLVQGALADGLLSGTALVLLLMARYGKSPITLGA